MNLRHLSDREINVDLSKGVRKDINFSLPDAWGSIGNIFNRGQVMVFHG